MTSGPLAGVKILDLTRLLPGGYATLLMADLGADVLKIEEPGRGDYIRWTPPMVGEQSAAHLALNRNKRSMTLNLKSARGLAVLFALAGDADVLVESFRPGVMARLGAGQAELRAANRRLVYCAITGYGQDGPRAGVAGHDVNYMGYAGALSIIGEAGRKPVIPGVQVGDLAGGGMAAVIAILAALHRRAATGEGDFCDIAMQDGLVSWLSIHAAAFFATGVKPEAERMHLSGAFPCYRIYPAADGWLTVGALEPQFWSALCDAIGRPDLESEAFAVGARGDQVIADLETLFRTRTRAAWMEVFAGRDVCVGPVNDFAEAFADEQVRHRQMVVGPGDRHGWRDVGNPLKLASARDGLVRSPAPSLGQHTEETLRTLGFSPEAIQGLRTSGAI